jgi:hypothetical protein
VGVFLGTVGTALNEPVNLARLTRLDAGEREELRSSASAGKRSPPPASFTGEGR